MSGRAPEALVEALALAWQQGRALSTEAARRLTPEVPEADGDLVAMGSWCGMLDMPPGATEVATFEDVGEVVMRRPRQREAVR